MQEETGRLWSKERGVDWKRELKKYKEKVLAMVGGLLEGDHAFSAPINAV